MTTKKRTVGQRHRSAIKRQHAERKRHDVLQASEAAFLRRVPAPTFLGRLREGVENLRDAVLDAQYQAEMRITMKGVERWTMAVSPAIHKPARALLKALKAAGFP